MSLPIYIDFSGAVGIYMDVGKREYHLNVNQIDEELLQHPRSTCHANLVATTKKTTIDSIAWAILPSAWLARVKRVKLVCRAASR